MPWKANRKLLAEGFPDLKYLPKERAGWDATLSCLAYGVRMDIERAIPDLGAWAARHCLPVSGRYAEFGGGRARPLARDEPRARPEDRRARALPQERPLGGEGPGDPARRLPDPVSLTTPRILLRRSS